MGQI